MGSSYLSTRRSSVQSGSPPQHPLLSAASRSLFRSAKRFEDGLESALFKPAKMVGAFTGCGIQRVTDREGDFGAIHVERDGKQLLPGLCRRNSLGQTQLIEHRRRPIEKPLLAIRVGLRALIGGGVRPRNRQVDDFGDHLNPETTGDHG